jgi:(p)ppGpp synthase/HD superfamily hydrolase
VTREDALLISRAADLAKWAHGDQKRKYTGEPYWVHLQEVAKTVEDFGGTREMIAAAWLHDTLEDTTCTPEHIASVTSDHTLRLVQALTDHYPSDGGHTPRRERKRKERERLSMCSGEVHTIKLADLISNTTSIVEHDPGFAKTYLEEKAALLDVLIEGHPVLRMRAACLLQRSLEQLESAS